ncbi:4Fe-4S binding protein [Desulfovibrio psychrotolerans]|uniref:(Fe-S)-binding protein n=1 Tax=Desulfovibrio psychrotolerans TaxID=415242 RepID=A0A7J0BWV7_9BACT|nr:4Fe-4S binding protein [Desulfovibrio psychrotolerans]GFM38200.1 (Fe-S)-binding protein [Desulfovibrio psychrotolerans]
MNIGSVTLLYFSPTGTTRTLLQSIAQGVLGHSGHGANGSNGANETNENNGASVAEHADITTPEARAAALRNITADTVLVVGMPVYMGRIPALAAEWLRSIRVQQVPVICVAVYGNRAYEDALAELQHLMAECGGVPVAAAAYIGEHSFSCETLPTAHGRPNADDLAHAKDFGSRVRAKLQNMSDLSAHKGIAVPGEYPSQKNTVLWSVDFIAVSDACARCGQCAAVCPAGAISPYDSAAINIEACITCCACIKQCPVQARSIKPGPVMEARKRLNSLFSAPKQPEVFL